MTDVLIVGAGPVGLACAIEVQSAGLSARIVDKGALVNSILGYPTNMEFFSTPELLEIGGHPFASQRYKPTREEALDYYRGVARVEGLDVHLYERVQRIDGEAGAFRVVTDKATHEAAHVVVATGFFDVPNRLGVPGEDRPNVLHYYKEPFAFAHQRVAVVGGKNSAAKAALDCYRHGAEVTLIHRRPTLSDSVKYWIRPDLENRIEEGSITAYFDSTVERVDDGRVVLATPDGPKEIANDWVLAMTGYRPDYRFLETLGLPVGDDDARTPAYDPETFESGRPGIYLAGTVCGGLRTGRWFIENGRFHARQIVQHLVHGTAEAVDFQSMHWKTAE